MRKKNIKNLSNKDLLKELSKVNWADVDLLKEYDERNVDGRIPKGKVIPLDKLEQYIKNKYRKNLKKKIS